MWALVCPRAVEWSPADPQLLYAARAASDRGDGRRVRPAGGLVEVAEEEAGQPTDARPVAWALLLEKPAWSRAAAGLPVSLRRQPQLIPGARRREALVWRPGRLPSWPRLSAPRAAAGVAAARLPARSRPRWQGRLVRLARPIPLRPPQGPVPSWIDAGVGRVWPRPRPQPARAWPCLRAAAFGFGLALTSGSDSGSALTSAVGSGFTSATGCGLTSGSGLGLAAGVGCGLASARVAVGDSVSAEFAPVNQWVWRRALATGPPPWRHRSSRRSTPGSWRSSSRRPRCPG